MNDATQWQCVEGPDDGCARFQYKGCGLDDVFLLNGVDKVHTSQGNGFVIRDLDGLHRVIGEHLVTQKKELSGKEVKFLRKQMDLTQAEVARFVGLSSQQIARWEKGQSPVTGPANFLIRKLYLEHISGRLTLRALVEELDNTDSKDGGEQVFKKTGGEWVPVAA